MVQNIGWVKAGNWDALREEGDLLLKAVHAGGGLLKVILETALLSDSEIMACCAIYGALGVDFVKTSTGFAEGGATVTHVTLMRRYLPAGIQIKAAGGIRTFAQAQALLAAGATRLGASAGVALVAEEKIA
jgi:deoxyribose-phosphate aldolase